MLTNYQHNTNKDVHPDPDLSTWDLRGPYIAVRPLEVEETLETKSGFSLIMPTETQETFRNAMCIGRVLKVSPAAHAETIQGPVPLKEGDIVMYDKLATGRKVPFRDVVIYFMSADEVISTLQNPKDVYLHNSRLRA